MSSPKNALSGASLALAALLSAALPAGAADETYLRPMIDVEQGWDSNIFNTDDHEEASLVTTISPALWFENRGELGEARAGVTARARSVWRESDLSGVDLLTRGELDRKITPRLSLFGDAAYDEYSGYDQIGDGDTAGQPGNILLEEQPSWTRTHGRGGFRYLLTERLSFSLSAYGGRINYESVDPSVDSGYYRDRTLYGGGSTLLYQLTALDQVMLDVGLDDTDYQDLGAGTNDTSIWSSEIGWSRNWTQAWSSTAKIGFSYTDVTQKDVPQGGGFDYFGRCTIFGVPIRCDSTLVGQPPVTQRIGVSDFSANGTALIGSLSLRRVFPRGFFELMYNRDTQSTGGSGRTNFDIDSFTLSWSHRLAERVRLTLTGNYSVYHSISDEIPDYAATVRAISPTQTVQSCPIGGVANVIGTIPIQTDPNAPPVDFPLYQCVGGSSEEKRHYTTLLARLEWQLRRRLSAYVQARYRTSKTDQELGDFGEFTTEDLDKFNIATGFRWYYDLGL